MDIITDKGKFVHCGFTKMRDSLTGKLREKQEPQYKFTPSSNSLHISVSIITDKGAFIQIGITAMRDPKTGDFLPSEPMYILRPAETVSKRTKMSEGEEELLTDVSGVFKTMADKMRQYVEGCGMEDWFSEDART